jgi:hypothetical protein
MIQPQHLERLIRVHQIHTAYLHTADFNSEVWRYNTDPWANSATLTPHREPIPMLSLEIPQELWDRIMLIYRSHQASISDHPTVQDAWEAYMMSYHLTNKQTGLRK